VVKVGSVKDGPVKDGSTAFPGVDFGASFVNSEGLSCPGVDARSPCTGRGLICVSSVMALIVDDPELPVSEVDPTSLELDNGAVLGWLVDNGPVKASTGISPPPDLESVDGVANVSIVPSFFKPPKDKPAPMVVDGVSDFDDVGPVKNSTFWSTGPVVDVADFGDDEPVKNSMS